MERHNTREIRSLRLDGSPETIRKSLEGSQDYRANMPQYTKAGYAKVKRRSIGG